MEFFTKRDLYVSADGAIPDDPVYFEMFVISGKYNKAYVYSELSDILPMKVTAVGRELVDYKKTPTFTDK